MVRFSDRVSTWKRPEYTGINRCIPCTAVNVALAFGLAFVGTGIASVVGIGWSVGAGLLVLAGSLLLIYFNGYLVPGTPELTKRYFPRRLLAAFGKDTPGGDPTGFDPDAELRTAGLVIEGSADLRLHPAFEREWRTAIEHIGTGDMTIEGEITQRLATLGGFDADGLTFVEGPTAYRAWYEDELVANWESRAACIADIAAADIIPEYDAKWYDRPLAMQAELLGALRLFVERCPACNGTVRLAHEVVSSCCYDYEVVATTCDGCNARLFEIETDGELPGESE